MAKGSAARDYRKKRRHRRNVMVRGEKRARSAREALDARVTKMLAETLADGVSDATRGFHMSDEEVAEAKREFDAFVAQLPEDKRAEYTRLEGVLAGTTNEEESRVPTLAIMQFFKNNGFKRRGL